MQHTGHDSNTDSELWEWVQVEKDEEKEKEREGMKEKELRVVEQERKKLKVAELFDDSSSMASEIIFPELVLAQVGSLR